MVETCVAERLLRRDKAVLIVLICVLFGLAGLYAVYGMGMRMTALEMTAMRGMKDMPGPKAPGAWTFDYALLVFLMWWLMMMAMMLPSVSPTVLLHGSLLRHSGKATQVPWTSSAFLMGYLVTWAFFSVLATFTQWSLEKAGVVSATMMTLIETAPGALVLIAAGVFQFTPLKAACLRHCRSPAEFITRRRHEVASGAFLMGLEHGVFCLGCCWFLMSLLFVGGIMNLYWIVGLTGLVAVEKLTPFGEVISKVAGAVLVSWGALTLV